jgi:uncharacterized protein YjdB
MLPAAQERDANDAVLEMLKHATIGDYEVLKELGRGGMATVYLAHDIALDRKVAIKVMSPALLLMGEGMSERFKREARTAANLSHPHIIPIYTVKSSGKSLFFVMKFISGRSLEAIIKDVGPMPVPMIKAILQQVGSALGYAHRHGVVHRDVKPANIMIDEEGWSVVTDFGIAKVAENRGLTMTGIAVGTPSYMSPEQCAAKDITGKSDQYSLGVVAYEMLTGKQPFEGDSAMAIMFAHFHEQPKPLEGIRADCPGDLSAAVMRMLEKAPDKRFPSMEDALGSMGAQSLGHDDPLRHKLIELAKKGSSSQILKQLTPPPTSPAPPAKTRQIVEQPTTPIPAPKVVSIAVVPARSDLHVGDTMQLTATPRAAGGTAAGGRMEWKSADPAIASVSATGLVTALAPGAATITATCEGISGSAKVTVTPIPVATVTVEPVEPTLAVGEQLTFRAVVRDPHGAPLHNREVKWSASPAGLITLSTAGEAKATREGVVEVHADCEGVKGSARVSVTPAPVGQVTLSPSEIAIRAGETATLTVALADRHGGKLTGRELGWHSSAEKVAVVDARGVVTGLAEGIGEITVRVEGKHATARVKVSPAAVASVSISEPKPIIAGDRVQLQVQLKDGRGQLLTGRAVRWSSSSPAIATVTSDGHVTGMAAGSAKITAECEGKSGTAGVTVQPVPAASIMIEGGVEPLPVGGVATLKALVKDARGNLLAGREVAWASSAARIATVNAQGVVATKAAGEATITATVEGKKAELRVTVVAPVEPVAPPKPVTASPTPSIAEARTEVIAPAEPKEAGVRTEVVAPRREPVRAAPPSGGKGKLIGVVAGVAVVAAVAFLVLQRGGRSGANEPLPPAPQPAPTPAPAPVASVNISSEPGPVAVGRTRQLAAVVRDASGNELTGRGLAWTSSDPAVAEVSALGAVTGLKPGAATITATAEGRSGSFALTVEAPTSNLPAAVASVSVNGGGRALEVGETMSLSAAAKDAKGSVLGDRTIVWSTGDPQVVLVGSTGLVTAVGPGTAAISASSEGKSGEVRVTVNAPKPKPKPPEPGPVPAPAPVPVAVASVSLTPDAPAITTGSTLQLSVAALDDKKKPVTDRPVTWKSSDERIAKVSADGLVTGVAKGSATITATVEGKSASSRVTVNEATVAVASVLLTAKTRSLKVGETTTWAAVARDGRGKDLSDRAIGWVSSAPEIATVSGAGLITAVAAGTAEIRAESEGKSSAERVTVAAAPAPPPAPTPGPPTPAGGNTALLPRAGVEAGGGFACGIAPSGAVCWGAGTSGITAVEGTAGITQLTLGRAHACGLLPGGRAVCWGDNRLGQLGSASAGATTAAPVTGDLSFSAIAAGAAHTCGIAGGKAYCWGKGKEGQLGDGDASDRKRPVAVKGGQSFVVISAGGDHSCAISGGGKAYCWGDGFSGQLGFGGQDRQVEPVDVSGGQKYERIAAGGKHTCALAAGGKIYCWGSNESGQLGDGSKSDRSNPVPVSSSAIFKDVSAGANHSCGLTAGGEAYCWGENRMGQLGDGTKNDRNKPVAVIGGQVFASVSAGEGVSCAMTRGGEALCWGRNDRGQLGDGTTTPRGTPGPVRP